MERLNHSGGPSKVQKSFGKTRFLGLGQSDGSDLLYFIRQAHPEFFMSANEYIRQADHSYMEKESRNSKKAQIDQQMTFDQLVMAGNK